MDINLNQIINEVYQNVINMFPSRNILGVFTNGKVNYNLAETEDDIQFVVVYIPTFDELCMTMGEDQYTYINEYKVTFVDIRKCYSSEKQINDCALELLFAQRMIINNKYKEIFVNNLQNNREKIGHYCDEIRIKKAYHRIVLAATIWKDDKDYDALLETSRLLISATKYLDGAKCQDCYFINDIASLNYLKSIQNRTLATPPAWNELIMSAKELLARANNVVDYEAIKIVKNTIIDIIRVSLKDNVDIEVFLNTLTAKEKIALSAIKNNITTANNLINISSLCSLTNISRPVYKNLLQKLEKNNVAEITNCGVNGMKINFLVDF